MTTQAIENYKAVLTAELSDFIPNCVTFYYGNRWIIGQANGQHVTVTRCTDAAGEWYQLTLIQVGMLPDLDDKANREHPYIEPVADGWEPTF